MGYLGQREFVSTNGQISDIKGIAHVPEQRELQGKFIFASLVVTFRHGREANKVQTRLLSKLGEGAKPFALSFPQSSPNSVLIKGEEGDTSEMGVSYYVRLHMGDSSEDYVGTKKATVTMSIRKSQYLTTDGTVRSPTAKAEKSFMFSKGKLGLECS